MASPTKTRTALLAAQSIAAGTTATSPWVNCTTFFEMLACLAITIPGGAPSAGPTITFSASPDGGATVYQLQQFAGLTQAQSYIFAPDDPTMYLQLAVKNNDGGSNAIVAVADLMGIATVA
jgi:hypothetical protein